LVAETRAVTADEIAGTLGLDPIGVRARTGAPADLAPLLELAEQSRAYPKLTPITVDAVAYHEAGGNDSQELAVAAAVAVAYVRALTDAGWSAAEAFGAIEFRYAVTADQFLSIAKLRAARRIWNRIGELCGVDAAARGQRQHAVTSPAMLTRRDPWVNMLRATVACFAAAAGGAESITVAPFDSAIGLSDDFARRIARNTQSILHDESSLARVADPAGGSWYVESITDQLAHAAWDVFTAIERAGGALAALDSGYIPGLLDETRWRRNDAVAHRRDPITGVSEFALITETAVSRPAYSAAPEGALLPQIRYAEEFELLRDRADAVLAASGERPVVFLACLGPVAAHTGRAGFAANLFQAGGFEPVIGTGDASELAAAFTASAATVACLCSSDKLYTDLAGPVASALKAAGANKIWLAGKPGERADSDAGSGIDGYIFAGCNAIDVLTATFDGLGVH
jgi:methylmalonyl-CoA mutase